MDKIKKNNLLVITYWSFENALIQTYTLPYIRQIKKYLSKDSKIYLFTLAQTSYSNEKIAKQLSDLKSLGIEVIYFKYHRFSFWMSIKMAFLVIYLCFFSLIKRIKTIHAWCTPGGAIGYLVSVITQKELVLDSFETHAEVMLESKTWRPNSLAFKILFKLEKLQLKRAREVICASANMINHSKKVYGITKPRYFVKPACVDLNLFDRTKIPDLDKESLGLKKIVCTYAGKFGDMYLEQEVFDLLAVAHVYWKGNFSALLLTNLSDEKINEFCLKSSLPREVVINRFVPFNEVPKYMKLGTFGICPVKPIPSRAFGTPIKNGEYWALGLPVIITKNISIDSHLIKSLNMGYVLEDLNKEEYLKSVQKINELLNETTLNQRIRLIAESERNFSIADRIYQQIYG